MCSLPAAPDPVSDPVSDPVPGWQDGVQPVRAAWEPCILHPVHHARAKFATIGPRCKPSGLNWIAGRAYAARVTAIKG